MLIGIGNNAKTQQKQKTKVNLKLINEKENLIFGLEQQLGTDTGETWKNIVQKMSSCCEDLEYHGFKRMRKRKSQNNLGSEFRVKKLRLAQIFKFERFCNKIFVSTFFVIPKLFASF